MPRVDRENPGHPIEVCVRLLGRFEVTCDGAVAVDGGWKRGKAAAIVKILALREGHSMHREELIAALWPEADLEAGANSLYKNLHHLRKEVRRAGGPRDIVHLENPSISLAPYVRVDLDEFRHRAVEARAAETQEALGDAIALAGPLLPHDLYEPWTEPQRAEIQRQTIDLRLRLADLCYDASAL